MTTYYVKPTGNDSNTGLGTSDALAWKTIGKANTTLTAGDTVYIMAGTYYEQIKPSNSGTSGNYITYSRYDTDTVNLYDQSTFVDLRHRDYIRVLYIRCEDTDPNNNTTSNGGWVNLGYGQTDDGATYCVIDGCYFERVNQYNGIYMHGTDCHHNQILNNTLVCRCDSGEQVSNTGPADAIAIKYGAHHNLIAGNTITDASHACIDIYGGNEGTGQKCSYNIIRDNTITTQWHAGIIIDNRAPGETSDYNLVENNTIYNCGSGCSASTCPENLCGSSGDRSRPDHEHTAFQHGTSHTIFRNNSVYGNGNGFSMTGNYAEDARIFNNTFYNNLRGQETNTSGDCHDNVIKNNIFYNNSELAMRMYISGSPNDNEVCYNLFESGATFNEMLDGTTNNGVSLSWMESTFPSEWHDNVTGNPQFTDADNADFTLGSGSDAIDAGDWLTTTANAGSSSLVLMVEDAKYFSDGYGLQDGDYIQFQGQTSTYQIDSINYDTGRIDLATAATWTSGLGVSLVYKGTAPDIGAEESIASEDVSINVNCQTLTFSVPTYSAQGDLVVSVNVATVSASFQLPLVSIVTEGAEGGNVLTDGGIENWDDANTPSNWGKSENGTSTVNREAVDVHAGTYSARLDVDASNSYVDIRQDITLVAETDYVIRLYYKNSAGSKTAGVTLHDTANNVYLKSDGTFQGSSTSISLANQTDWTKYELDFTTPATYTDYRLHFRTADAASSSIYFDAAELNEYSIGSAEISANTQTLSFSVPEYSVSSDANVSAGVQELTYSTPTPTITTTGESEVATIYYVKNDGDDDKSGTSDDNAWKTIAKVNASSFTAGDSIKFNKGDTWREQLVPPSSGSSGSPITFSYYGTGNAPIIKGSDLVTGWTRGDWVYILQCDDNAASTVVLSSGTDDTSWIASGNTSTLHSDTAKTGTGSFDMNGDNRYIYTDGNWTDESVTFQFWWRPNDATASAYEFIIGINDGDDSSEANEINIVRHGGSDELAIRTRNAADNGATSYQTSDFSPSANTWYQIRVEIGDCSVSPWTGIAIKYRTDASASWTTLTGSWTNGNPMAATLNNPVRIGIDDTEDPDAFIDDVKVMATSGSATIWEAYCDTEPNLVFFDGTEGNAQTVLADVDSENDWFWQDDVLYVYSTTDPDTAYTSPGIEAGVRNSCVSVADKNYVTLDGLHIQHANGTSSSGVGATGTTTNLTVQNCSIDYIAGAGIWLYRCGVPHTVDTCIIHDCGRHGVKIDRLVCTSSNMGEVKDCTVYNTDRDGINIEGDYWVVESNTVYDIADGLTDMQGIQICAGTTNNYGNNNIIRYNLVYNVNNGTDTGDGSGINLDIYADNNQVYYNIVYNCDGAGILLYRSHGHEVYNNVCYGNAQGTNTFHRAEIRLAADAGNETYDCIVKNNLCYPTHASAYAITVDANATPEDNTIDYNCYYKSSGDWWKWGASTGSTIATWRSASSQGAHDINSNPSVTDAAGHDYTLTVSSPCRNAGVAVDVPDVDYAGNLVTDPPDIGAYEKFVPSGSNLHMNQSLGMT